MDASGYAIGGILGQGHIGKDLLVTYISRLLSKAKQNYFTIENELLAIVYSVHFFRPYVYGRKFTLAIYIYIYGPSAVEVVTFHEKSNIVPRSMAVKTSGIWVRGGL